MLATIQAIGCSADIVFNPINNKIYCANYDEDRVTVIDCATNTVLTNIIVGDWPQALVYNSINNKIYCANSSSDNITVINGTTNSVITTVPVGSYPCGFLYNLINNKIYCINAVSDDVTIINGATDQVISTIAVGNWPRAVTHNPLQNRVYVANYYYGNTISVIRDVMPGMEERTTLDATHSSLEVYPNPAKTFFTIRLPSALLGEVSPLRGGQSADRILIYDVSGKLVKEILRSAQNDNTVRISLDGIKNGVYFVQVGDVMVKEKLVITK